MSASTEPEFKEGSCLSAGGQDSGHGTARELLVPQLRPAHPAARPIALGRGFAAAPPARTVARAPPVRVSYCAAPPASGDWASALTVTGTATHCDSD
jgi:hypothetical protein